jgi:putative ABC transport system substrate-binding protein
MHRREFFGVVGGAAAWPLDILAQPAGKLPNIGFLGPSTASAARERIVAFEQRLRQLGWIEGRNVAIHYQWADGKTERFGVIASEFVRLGVDVIATWGTATAVAAKQATSTVPVVFTVVGDPVGAGLVASLSHPGGNVTGLSTQHSDAAGKGLELLREAVPNLRRLGIIANVDNPGPISEMRKIQGMAQMLGLDVEVLGIRRAEDIAAAFAAIECKVDALYVTADALIFTNRNRINTLAIGARYRRCTVCWKLPRPAVSSLTRRTI